MAIPDESDKEIRKPLSDLARLLIGLPHEDKTPAEVCKLIEAGAKKYVDFFNTVGVLFDRQRAGEFADEKTLLRTIYNIRETKK